jgi:hypothetical protein
VSDSRHNIFVSKLGSKGIVFFCSKICVEPVFGLAISFRHSERKLHFMGFRDLYFCKLEGQQC